MKRVYVLMLTSVIAVMCYAPMMAQPIITFLNTEYDFGTIEEDGGKATAVFTFRNDGNEPLVITDCHPLCGCTTADWERSSVAPHSAGQIKVIYNPANRPGGFHKSVKVYSNASQESTTIYVTGRVTPSPLPCIESAFDNDNTAAAWGIGKSSNEREAAAMALQDAIESLARRFHISAQSIEPYASIWCRKTTKNMDDEYVVYVSIGVKKDVILEFANANRY